MRGREAMERAVFRVRHALRPLVTITEPPDDVRAKRDVEVPMRDGTVLRVNVFQPPDDGSYPVILCAHPYGKDNLPKARRRGDGYRIPWQLRMIPQSEALTISAWTSWEAPDPVYWVHRGYVVVNADLRGWGRSDGIGEILSEQEALDYHDLIEWAGVQPWSNGNVGLSGVSYLAIAQWGAAATRPPHLAAITPWEGFTDAYRDLARPGGIREDGFLRVWTIGLRRQRRSPVDIRAQQKARPCFDEWWKARVRNIEQIEVPALVCASFSDHNLHSGGSFRGFEHIGSNEKWLYTHRGPKWSTYYGSEALRVQAQFFDHYLRGDDTAIEQLPAVRLEVREDADTITSVRAEPRWPLTSTEWRRLHLDAAAGRLITEPNRASAVTFDARKGEAIFVHRFDEDTEVTGPMALQLHLSVDGANDIHLFAGARKRRGGRVVGFEGSYGFRHALITLGWLKASHRALDSHRSRPFAPRHTHDHEDRLEPGEIVRVDIGLLPSATLFRRGESLEIVIRGRWFFPRNPLLGQFPAWYERSPAARCTLHTGGPHDAALLLPVVPRDRPTTAWP